MTNVSCDIVRDLLPLYVDGVLSPDSQKLVEDHLAACAPCRGCHEELRRDHVRRLGPEAGREGNVIRKLRRQIKAKRLRAVCLTAVTAALIAGFLYYEISWQERYVPYDSSAFYVYNQSLCVKQYYHPHCYSFTEDGTQFIYLTATVADNCRRQRQAAAAEQPADAYGKPFVINEPHKPEVYYISEDYAERLRQGYWEEYWGESLTESEYADKSRELLAELKAASILIAAEDEADAGGPADR